MRIGYGRAVGAAVAVSIALRLRFLFAPLLADEAGALSAARDWAGGGKLYQNVWIDRPQGFIALFRVWDALPHTDASSTRILAVLLGAVAVVAVASVGRSLFTAGIGAMAAILTAAVTASPLLEGFASNGELLAAGFALPALAVVAAVIAQRCATWWMLVAGVLFGCALAVKQSTFDVLVAVLAWLALAWLLRWQQRRTVVVSTLLLGVGVSVVLAAVAWHGSTLGWHDYWYAMAGFRLGSRSGLSNPELDRLGRSLLFVSVAMAPAVALMLHARSLLAFRSLLRRPHAMLIVLWASVSLLAFVTGGSFHRHYFIILAYPLALLAAVAGDRSRQNRRYAGAAAAIALVAAVPFIANPRLILGDVSDTNREVAAWIHEQETRRGPLTVYAYCADAALYTELGQAPPFRYLWEDHVRLAEGGQQGLFDLLTGPKAPDFVIRLQPLEQCDESGMLATAIEQHYRSEGLIGDAEVLRRSDLPATAG
ncbi:MAG: hypothetical protein HY826_10915 [Actinobacteria bacterium]|nr:hypothetical protein [Actinomycetota bacterium]